MLGLENLESFGVIFVSIGDIRLSMVSNLLLDHGQISSTDVFLMAIIVQI
jgi:hypothetical protein